MKRTGIVTSRQQAAGSRQQAAGSRQQANLRFFSYFLFLSLIMVLLSNTLTAQSDCYSISPASASGTGIEPLDPCDIRYVELDQLPFGGPCDSVYSDDFIVKIYIHILTKLNGTGAQSINLISQSLDLMVEKYAPFGIGFSFEELNHLPITDSLYYFLDTANFYNEIFDLDDHSDGIDIYYCGPGILNNGRAQIKEPDSFLVKFSACVVGGGIYPKCDSLSLISSLITAHEVGHCLGILHPEEITLTYPNSEWDVEDCNNNSIDPCYCGDHIDDTEYVLPYEQFILLDNCDCDTTLGIGAGVVFNLMSGYSPLECRSDLTWGQANRMKRFLAECSTLQQVVDTTDTIIIHEGLDITYSHSFLDCFPEIIVEPGAKLTIQTSMQFDEGKGITIQGGGRVIVQGVKLSGCGGADWRGIDVEGSQSVQAPYASNGQGYLTLGEGSEVVDADHPVRTTYGAIVRATGTDFRDCGAITFRDYPRSLNFSYFVDCHFTRDQNLAYINDNQIQLENMGFMSIRDCSFYVDGHDHSMYALEAFDSRFNMSGCTVENFQESVHVSGWFGNAKGNFSVKQCTFKNNLKGIEVWASKNFTITGNSFEGIGDYLGGYYDAGLDMQDCKSFTVSGNSFKGVTSTMETFGIRVGNTGSESNIIKNNFYEDLDSANRAEGDNKGAAEDEGLQYHCNTNNANNGNRYDFHVFDVGIAESQGGGFATQNIFSHSNSTLGDLNNQSANGFVYYHGLPQAETPLPGYFTDSNVFPQFSSTDADCTGGIGGGGVPEEPSDHVDKDSILTTGGELYYTQAYENAYAAFDSISTLYNGKLNGGQSESSLIGQLMLATSYDTTTIKQDLLDYSPYLTTKVLGVLVARSDLFSDQALFSILSSNPDELRSITFQDYLYLELDEALVDTILTYRNQMTARTNEVAVMTLHRTDMHLAANRIIKSILADTASIDLDEYRQWLDKKVSKEAAYEKVGTYIANDEYARAESYRDSIPLLFNLQGNDLTEHGHYADLSDIAIDALENHVHCSEFDSTTVAQVQAIADASDGLAARLAQGLLNFYYGYSYEIVQSSSGGAQQMVAQPTGQFNTTDYYYQPLTAQPNPAKDKVTFKYDLELEAPAKLVIFDVNGRLVQSFQLEDQKGSIDWGLEHLSYGVYFCQVRQSDNISPSLKLVLVK